MEDLFMKNLEKAIDQAITQTLVKRAEHVISYSHGVIDAAELYREAFRKIDFEKVKNEITEMLQNILAEKIITITTNEFCGDIKKMMSNIIIRNDIRDWLQVQTGKLIRKLNQTEGKQNRYEKEK